MIELYYELPSQAASVHRGDDRDDIGTAERVTSCPPEGVEAGSFPEDGGCTSAARRPTTPGCSCDSGVRARVFAGIESRIASTVLPALRTGASWRPSSTDLSCAAAVFVADQFVVTGELVIRYEAPVPVETPIELEAEITSRAHARYAESTAVIRQGDTRLARSTGKFFYQERRSQP